MSVTPAEPGRTSPATERGWPQDDALQHQASGRRVVADHWISGGGSTSKDLDPLHAR